MVYLPDESLHHLLPGGRISFDTMDGHLLNYPHLASAEELLTNVLQAIEAYREKQPLSLRISQL
ncbi:hypothetical protein [Flavisolibacter tropicus]|uniref:hypothetical protein n=1 Tax=Flavisolibacter tropicus TaxID=1492898 RepID=UPI0011DF24B7|nr:hypothetical protein [Flavisolibacter tropicus]